MRGRGAARIPRYRLCVNAPRRTTTPISWRVRRLLLAQAEAGEDAVQEVLGGRASVDPVEGVLARAQGVGGDLERRPGGEQVAGPLELGGGVRQGLAVARGELPDEALGLVLRRGAGQP